MLKRIRIVHLIGVAIAIAVGILYWQAYTRCEQLKVQPSIEIYHESIFNDVIDTYEVPEYSILASSFGASEHGRFTARYNVDKNYRDVITFYETIGQCYEEINNIACNGNARPHGVFYIYITPLEERVTSYIVQLDWSMCGTRL